MLRQTVLDCRLDLYWPDSSFAVEVDSYGTHGSQKRFESDRVRVIELRNKRGIEVAQITDTRIRDRSEHLAIVAEIAGGVYGGRRRTR